MTEDPGCDATKIEVLTAMEAVRRRPAMYVGDMQDPSLPARLLMQALCHAADCAMDGECSRVEIRIDGQDVEVEYDAGMPIDPEAGDADQAPPDLPERQRRLPQPEAPPESRRRTLRNWIDGIERTERQNDRDHIVFRMVSPLSLHQGGADRKSTHDPGRKQ